MQIEKYIGSLLFEHDCVIVPGFGGFICNYAPAGIHAGKHQFHPPFKKISFNRNLKNNDGLLANQISQEENISYTEAVNRIASCIEQVYKELTQQSRVELKYIGTFFLGPEQTLSFEQDETVNYLPGSFGLTVFHAPAIKREPITRKLEKQLRDKILAPVKDPHEKVVTARRIPVMRYVAVAASLLVLFSLFFIYTHTGLLKNTDLANLNPFGKKMVALYQAKASDDALPDADASKDNVSNLLALAKTDTLRYLNIMLNRSIPIVVSLQDEPKAAAKPAKKKAVKSFHFHIVGGAFAISENAQKFLSRLIGLGYEAIIIDKKGGALHFVSYGGYATREEALQALEKIRAVQKDVWLMTN